MGLGNFVDDSYRDKKSEPTSYNGNYHVSVRIGEEEVIYLAMYSPKKKFPVVLEIKVKGLAKKVKETLELEN